MTLRRMSEPPKRRFVFREHIQEIHIHTLFSSANNTERNYNFRPLLFSFKSRAMFIVEETVLFVSKRLIFSHMWKKGTGDFKHRNMLEKWRRIYTRKGEGFVLLFVVCCVSLVQGILGSSLETLVDLVFKLGVSHPWIFFLQYGQHLRLVGLVRVLESFLRMFFKNLVFKTVK